MCALASLLLVALEYPLYFARGAFPSSYDGNAIVEFTVRNSRNIMACVLMDLPILALLVVFFAGFRHLIHCADATLEWLTSVFWGLGLVYVTLTLVADSLQGATVVDALSVPPNATALRGMLESMCLLYGSVALFLMSAFIALGGALVHVTRALPLWSAAAAYVCSVACFAFVPSMFVGHVDITGFYNPAGWGPLALAAGVPLGVWVAITGALMLRHAPSGARAERSGEHPAVPVRSVR